MKRFYLIFLAIPVLFFTLLYFSIWLFVGGLAAVMLFIVYHIYHAKLRALSARNEVLMNENDEVHQRLEQSFIKEQRAMKEVQKGRHLKKELLSVISHEIRTPMNGVMGMSLLLGDTSLTKEQEEYVNAIRKCGESLLTTINSVLVDDMLDFSKLEQQGKLEYEDFDLTDTIEEVLDMFALKAARAGLDIVYAIDENIPTQIIGDHGRIRQVLMNLVENAIKFTRRGEVFVAVHCLKTNDQFELRFEIKDTGVGIPKERLKNLFKGIPGKEIRRDNEEDRRLGLVICNKLVEFMGGRIEVKSQINEGSTFTFTIPLTPSLKSLRDHAQQSKMTLLEGKRVLIVDDNATQRTVLGGHLNQWKIVTVLADSSRQAMDILSNDSNFDLILADAIMPVTNGIELTRSIRSKYAMIPVILMNPAGDETYKAWADLFSGVLTKPIRHNLLREQILNVFMQANTEKQKGTDKLPTSFAEQYPLRILMAEDNIVNQKIATKVLNKLGYEPTIANNGKEALDIVSHEQYDIILMDVQMPEMDGLEATKMIRTCLEVQPVVIAMTANVMQGDRDACMQAGMDDYMSKPIDLKVLLSQLEKWSLSIRDKRQAI